MPTEVRTSKKRIENAAARRRQILEAALASIEEKGLSGTTLATVASKAGLSQGATVFYFESKDQLFVEAFRMLCADYRDSWMRIVDADYADPIERLLAFIFFDIDEETGVGAGTAAWFAFWGEARSRADIAAIAERQTADRHDYLRRLSEQARAKMQADQWTIDSFVKVVEALSDGLWLQIHISDSRDAVVSACQSMADYLTTVFPSEKKKIHAYAKRVTG